MSTKADLERLNDNGVQRSAEILSIVSQGGADQQRGSSMGWHEIQSKIVGRGKDGKDIIAKIKVMRKVLTIGGIRVSANHQDAQHIADWYGAKMLTEKISDLINQQATVRLPILAQGRWTEPASATTDGTMSRLFRVFDYDKIVTDELVKMYNTPDPPGLYVNEGKEWILSDKYGPNMKEQVNPNSDTRAKYKDLSCNHGWYLPGSEKSSLGPGPAIVKKIQSQGHRHDMNHNDYSQLLRFVKGVVYVSLDGGENYEKMKYGKILKDPNLVSLLSYFDANMVPSRHPSVQKKFWKGKSV